MIDLRRRPQQVSAPGGRSIATRLRYLVYLLGIPFLLIGVMSAVVLQIQNNAIERLELVIVPAVQANDLVLQTMIDSGIGLRVSLARELLTPHRVAEARTMAALATLQDELMPSSTRDVALRARLDGQRLAVEQWWVYVSSTEQAAGRGDRVDVRHGYMLFDNFRRANAALSEYLTTEHNQIHRTLETLAVVGMASIITISLAALLAALVLGVRFVRFIGQPISELHVVMIRQREGDPGAHAREDLGSPEVRALAVDFNALTQENLGLQETQTRGLRMHELTFEIERAIHAASGIQQVLDITCAALGEGLGVDRVMINIFDSDHNVTFDVQWHLPDLPPLVSISHPITPQVGRRAEELRLSSERRVIHNFLPQELQSQERAQIFRRETGAQAVIVLPIGVGDRAIGTIYVITVHEPRQWIVAEVNAVEQIAVFVAEIIVEDEHRTLQKEYIERLERLDRQMASFLATVSHELRTPLTSISGYLELLQDGDAGELTGEQHRMLGVVDRNTSRLRTLIGDLLLLNQIESGGLKVNVTEVSMRDLIIHAGQELLPIAHSGAVELDIDAGPEATIVQGDRGHLQRAVVNIVSNAIKFSHPGGVVTIRCTLDQGARRVLFTCQDRGIGIPVDDQAQLFTRFYRASNVTDQAITGTGLGLAIAKQIVEDHGGELRLASVEGEGTTVVIDLPLPAPD